MNADKVKRFYTEKTEESGEKSEKDRGVYRRGAENTFATEAQSHRERRARRKDEEKSLPAARRLLPPREAG